MMNNGGLLDSDLVRKLALRVCINVMNFIVIFVKRISSVGLLRYI